MSEKRLSLTEKLQLIEGRITETQRLKKMFNNNKLILPYFWYKYQDTNNFLNEVSNEISNKKIASNNMIFRLERYKGNVVRFESIKC